MPGFNYSRIIRAATQFVQGLVRQSVWDVRDYGGILDGAPHPLSASFATLAAAQVVWPEATALTNQIDRMAAQRALNAVPSGGGVLYCSGTLVSDGVPLTRAINNVKIRGDGWGSTIKLAAGVTPGGAITANLIEITGVSGWIVEDLAFDGNAGNNTTDNQGLRWHPIYSTGSDHCTVRRVKTSNSLSCGIFFASGSYHTIENNRVDGGNLYNATTTYMSEGGIRVFSDHTTVRRNHVTGWWKEIYVSAPDCIVEDNTCVHSSNPAVQQNDANSIEVYAPTGQAINSARCIVRGNVVENAWQEGIQLGFGSDGSICEGNTVRSSYYALSGGGAALAAALVLAAGNVTAGAHQYAYSYVTLGVESQLSPLSTAVTNDGTHQQNSITGITAGPAGTTARKVYRNVAAGTAMLLLTTIGDNTTTTYTDNTADGSLGAAYAGIAAQNIGIIVLCAAAIVRGNQVAGFRYGIQTQVAGNVGPDAVVTPRAIIQANHVYAPAVPDGVQSYGIWTGDAQTTVAANIVEGVPIRVEGNTSGRVAGNDVQSSNWHGIYIVALMNDLVIEGNTCDTSAAYGIYANSSAVANATGMVIAANKARRGLNYPGVGGDGIHLTKVSFGSVVGNVCTDNQNAGLAFQTCDHLTVSGNILTDTRASGKTQTTGLVEASFGGPSDFLTVVGNELRGNQTNALTRSTGANNVYRSNAGYNPVGVLGPPAVPATTVAYTNAYGVDATVYIQPNGATISSISVAGTATGATSGAFRVPAGSTIALAYTVATPSWTWFGD